MGVETPISIFSAVLHGRPSGGRDQAQRAIMVARAARDFSAGEVLTMGGHHHAIDGTSPRLLPPSAAIGAAPYYLAANKRLRAAVPRGADVPVDALDLNGSALYQAWLKVRDLPVTSP